MKRIFTSLFFCALCVSGFSQFTTGNLVILRVGTTGTSLTNTSREVFLDEFTPAGTLVQTITIPTTGDNQLTLTGTSTTEGSLSRSTNGAYLVMGGYKLPVGTSSPTAVGASASRIILRIDKAGTIEATTVPYASLLPNGAFRAVASVDGSAYWAAGGTTGVNYVTHGSTTSTVVNNTVTNLRYISIFYDQLYVTHASGSTYGRIMAVGTGLPTASGSTSASLSGINTSGGSPANIFMADLDNTIPGPDVMYLADDGQGILKYSLVGGSWVGTGSVGLAADTLKGLTGSINGTTVTLYATGKGGGAAAGGGQLVKIEDPSGYNGSITGQTITVLATAAVNTSFRGVAFAPLDAVQPLSLVNFTASRTTNGNLLQWRTSKEYNTASFNIESSTNGISFKAVGSKIARGSQLTNDYDFTDQAAVGTTVYYRLKMMDKSGSFRYSNTVKLAVAGFTGFGAWPNPATNGQVNVKYPASTQKASLRVIAADGRQMSSTLLSAGSFQTSLNTAGLKPGVYKVVYEISGDRKTTTMVIQ